ncbi:MAG: 1-aminocyclopropane-1-carboxylate deaminase/D-cysteine desulfhydrase [Planctomycetota bacterium]|jgi:D-cysteine desulfhydrase
MRFEWPDRIPLANLPTPIQEVPAFSKRLGRGVFIKRDDLTECVGSGNKVRKLEFLLAEAKAQGADTVVTAGSGQSNHCRATAWACRKIGLEPHLVLVGEPDEESVGNLFLDRVLGASFTFVSREEYAAGAYALLAGVGSDLSSRGKRPYLIPVGGSNGLGCMGYMKCAEEIARFREDRKTSFARIYYAAGSGGTSAGLILGAEAFDLSAEVLGVNVGEDHDAFLTAIRRIVGEAVDRFRIPLARPVDEILVEIVEGYAGEGYGRVSRELASFLLEVARTTGIVLDPVYTGKAFLGLVGEEEKRSDAGNILFIHTGGIFGLFAHGEDLLPSGETFPSV